MSGVGADSGPEAVSPELAAADAAARPHVALPGGGVPTWVLMVAAMALGLAVLLLLNGRRVADTGPVPRAWAPPAVPALPPALARPLDMAPVRAEAEATTPAPFAEAVPASTRSRFGEDSFDRPFERPAPPMQTTPVEGTRPYRSSELVDGAGRGAFRTEPPPGAPQPGGGGIRTSSGGGSALVYDAGAAPGTQDDRPAGPDSGVRARLMRNRPAIVAQGEVMAATLETPVSSARPGPIRAVIARDVRGFDGSRILIPRGSRLVGEYRADPVPGRRRVLATWTRLIRPDGVAIRIDSPASDALGGTGIPGRVDTHFLARFANAALQSALQIGVNLASRAGNGSVIVTGTPQLSTAVGPTIIPGADQPPTVSVPAGAAIAVFVARDLDFSGVPAIR